MLVSSLEFSLAVVVIGPDGASNISRRDKYVEKNVFALTQILIKISSYEKELPYSEMNNENAKYSPKAKCPFLANSAAMQSLPYSISI